MIVFTTRILKFEKQGEKTGWTYIEIPVDIAQKLKPGNKKSPPERISRAGFRVKGKLDNFPVNNLALIPMGGGIFIMALNASLRKGIGKRHGAMLKVQLEIDKKPYQLNADFIECLADEPKAKLYFDKLAPSHRNYFSKWIESAKTPQTRIKRIAQAVTALGKSFDFGKMLREAKKEKDDLL